MRGNKGLERKRHTCSETSKLHLTLVTPMHFSYIPLIPSVEYMKSVLMCTPATRPQLRRKDLWGERMETMRLMSCEMVRFAVGPVKGLQDLTTLDSRLQYMPLLVYDVLVFNHP